MEKRSPLGGFHAGEALLPPHLFLGELYFPIPLIPLRFKIGVYAESKRITGKAGALRWAGALPFRQAQDPELAEGLRATNAASDSFGPVLGMRGLLEVAALPGQLRASARF
jgi:hypothetical protein